MPSAEEFNNFVYREENILKFCLPPKCVLTLSKAFKAIKNLKAQSLIKIVILKMLI